MLFRSAWLPPKLVPVMTKEEPIAPELGDTWVITGITEKDWELLDIPPTVTETSTLPGKRLLGTGTVIRPSLQLVGAPITIPKLTVLEPCAAPNPPPMTVTDEPTGVTGPTVGEIIVILGEVANAVERKISSIVYFRPVDLKAEHR